MFQAGSKVPAVIRLINGNELDLLDPDPKLIDLHSVALPLSRICRFGGHSPFWYSVAEHSIHCLTVAEKHGLEFLREVFMHDAAEAFIGDVVRPLKVLLPEYEVIELRMERAIRDRFGLSDTLRARAAVERVDLSLLKHEKRFFWPCEQQELNGRTFVTDCVQIASWDAETAYDRFIDEADRLRIR